MSEQNGREPKIFVQTKNYVSLPRCAMPVGVLCIGLGYGPPGTGKTESARYYAQWDQ